MQTSISRILLSLMLFAAQITWGSEMDLSQSMMIGFPQEDSTFVTDLSQAMILPSSSQAIIGHDNALLNDKKSGTIRISASDDETPAYKEYKKITKIITNRYSLQRDEIDLRHALLDLQDAAPHIDTTEFNEELKIAKDKNNLRLLLTNIDPQNDTKTKFDLNLIESYNEKKKATLKIQKSFENHCESIQRMLSRYIDPNTEKELIQDIGLKLIDELTILKSLLCNNFERPSIINRMIAMLQTGPLQDTSDLDIHNNEKDERHPLTILMKNVLDYSEEGNFLQDSIIVLQHKAKQGEICPDERFINEQASFIAGNKNIDNSLKIYLLQYLWHNNKDRNPIRQEIANQMREMGYKKDNDGVKWRKHKEHRKIPNSKHTNLVTYDLAKAAKDSYYTPLLPSIIHNDKLPITLFHEHSKNLSTIEETKTNDADFKKILSEAYNLKPEIYEPRILSNERIKSIIEFLHNLYEDKSKYIENITKHPKLLYRPHFRSSRTLSDADIAEKNYKQFIADHYREIKEASSKTNIVDSEYNESLKTLTAHIEQEKKDILTRIEQLKAMLLKTDEVIKIEKPQQSTEIKLVSGQENDLEAQEHLKKYTKNIINNEISELEQQTKNIKNEIERKRSKIKTKQSQIEDNKSKTGNLTDELIQEKESINQKKEQTYFSQEQTTRAKLEQEKTESEIVSINTKIDQAKEATKILTNSTIENLKITVAKRRELEEKALSASEQATKKEQLAQTNSTSLLSKEIEKRDNVKQLQLAENKAIEAVNNALNKKDLAKEKNALEQIASTLNQQKKCIEALLKIDSFSDLMVYFQDGENPPQWETYHYYDLENIFKNHFKEPYNPQQTLKMLQDLMNKDIARIDPYLEKLTEANAEIILEKIKQRKIFNHESIKLLEPKKIDPKNHSQPEISLGSYLIDCTFGVAWRAFLTIASIPFHAIKWLWSLAS